MKEAMYAHSYIKYACKNCSREWLMFCPAGVEDWGMHKKKAPSPIRCSCGDLANKVSDTQKILIWHRIEPHESYFVNYKDCKYGVPVLRGKIHESR